MVLVPEADVTRLDMSVSDGVKYIVSLGSISPEPLPGRIGMTETATGLILRTRPSRRPA